MKLPEDIAKSIRDTIANRLRVRKHKALRKAGFASTLIDYDGAVLDLAVRLHYLSDDETTDPVKVRAAFSQMLFDAAHPK